MSGRTTDRHPNYATCDVCGKRGYMTRDIARSRREITEPGAHLSAYRCEGDGLWHLGNLPAAVIRGDVDRSFLFGDVPLTDVRWPRPGADWTVYDEMGRRRPPTETLRLRQQLAGAA